MQLCKLSAIMAVPQGWLGGHVHTSSIEKEKACPGNMPYPKSASASHRHSQRGITQLHPGHGSKGQPGTQLTFLHKYTIKTLGLGYAWGPSWSGTQLGTVRLQISQTHAAAKKIRHLYASRKSTKPCTRTNHYESVHAWLHPSSQTPD